VGGSKLGMAAALEEEREAREGRSAVKAEVRRWKKDQRDELEEMLPKATGRYGGFRPPRHPPTQRGVYHMRHRNKCPPAGGAVETSGDMLLCFNDTLPCGACPKSNAPFVNTFSYGYKTLC